MVKDLFHREDASDETEDDEDQEEEEVGERRRRRIMITVVSGRRSGGGGGGGEGSMCCQADECSASLSQAKRYHRRHKVCERHAKAAVVLVAGVRQRFCQQCSRFHELLQFDGGKRSCRNRLAGHNERRRKAQPEIIEAEEDEKEGLTVADTSLQRKLSNKHLRTK